MELPRLAVVLGLALGAHAQCEVPWSSIGPLPPVLPGNFHMVYEKNDLLKGTTSFYNVWYDWTNQKARVDEVAGGKGRVLLFDFDSGAGFAYDVARPGTEETTDARSLGCRYFPIDEESPYLYFYNQQEKPLRMVDVYHALLFGGPFRYAYAGNASDESSRFIDTYKFESCVVDNQIGKTVKIVYYWSLEDSSEKPIKCEREGEDLKEVLSIIRFQRDPDFPQDTFVVPRHLDCIDNPAVVEAKELPVLSDDFAWREETMIYSTDDEGEIHGNVIESYKEIWVADQYKLARLDWTPTTAEVENTFLGSWAGEPLSIVADVSYGAIFITDKNNGRCVVQPLTEEFLLSKKEGDKLTLRTAAELLGIDGPRVMKGEYLERGNGVIVYSTNLTMSMDGDFSYLHETTLRFDLQQAVDSYGAHQFVPVSQLTRRIASDPENTMPAKIRFEQTNYFRYRSEHRPLHVFAAPGCIAHHKRRHFELRFASSSWDMIGKRKNAFLDELRHQIYLRGDFGTVMRVQDVDVIENSGEQLEAGGDVIARMTLLEPLEEIHSGNAVTVDEAARRIAEVVDEGNMAIPFAFKDIESLMALENSFKEIKYGGDVAFLKRSDREVVEKAVAEIGPGYSLGAFIGLCFFAFALGIAVGVLVVYLKVKSSEPSTADELPLGDIERNQTGNDLNRPGTSGWRQHHADSMDD